MTTTTNAKENTTATQPAVEAKKEITVSAKAEAQVSAIVAKTVKAVEVTGEAIIDGFIAAHLTGKAWAVKVRNKVDQVVNFEVSDDPKTLAEKAKVWARAGLRVTLYVFLCVPAYLCGFVWGFCKGAWRTFSTAWKGATPPVVDKTRKEAIEEAAKTVDSEVSKES